ncbi:NAD-dependent succinate-semialdehyde dehydrogenase [Novosphingobium pentaromativorans]|uniref:Putative vanillin dehydrogenase n=1 Tax=Novosphingobium pentaromativorans US6-1 TaxID=1088721 RepID=G6EGA9_9SPHN|nr:NAD-dependent succinate-semialdehyde dehydrogenase [Novosphingobium pentaromativorans]AIT82206.1 aldehyde dehydrogenase [Novosphingobium pentaromativorans US6-1]EHJ59798.1 putative vanillin dehydrogenase [Novosphingobium pentaromativorans US6-1]
MTSDATYPSLALHIDGEWIGQGNRAIHNVVNPATGGTLAELPLVSADDLDRALDAAERGFAVWRRTDAATRAQVLKTAAGLIRERADHIARIATLEEGKTFGEARIEAQVAANLFEFYAEECKRTYGRVLVRPTGSRSIVVKEPVGVVAAFAPWNFPIGNPARKFGAPIAAGCSVILKPAEESPGAAIEILKALLDAGLPTGVAQLVFGEPDQVSRHLLASPIVRKLSFTGSIPVGKHLLKLAADTVKRTTMELGGHAPVIVFDDADLDQAVQMLAMAKSRNCGQVCVSPTRFFVQEGIYDRFRDAFAERFGALKIGNGLHDGVQMGPMANPRRPAAMARLIEDAVSNGARLITGGEAIGDEGFFWQPTVLADVPGTARIMNEEPFGPIASLTPFATLDEVVERANSLPMGLAGYAFTQSAKRAMLIGDALEVGMVGINVATTAAADAPFGGVKESGHGAEDGPEGLDACLVTKAIHQQ